MNIGKLSVKMNFIFVMALLYFLDGDGLLPFAIIAAVIHEMGHIVAMKLCGVKIDRVYLSCYGAKIEMAAYPLISCQREIIIALAGPLVGGIAAILLAITGNDACVLIAGFSVVLTIFNLLPAETLDGGRAIKYCTILLLNDVWQMRITRVGNILSAAFLIFVCIYISVFITVSPSLCVFCVFVAISFLKEFF